MIQQFHYRVYIQKKGSHCPRDSYQRDNCTLMFIRALFTITKMWNQLKCPSTDEDIENVVYIHKETVFSHKKAWNPVICDNINGPGGYHVKWNKSGTDK